MSLDEKGYEIVDNVLAPDRIEQLLQLTVEFAGRGFAGARNLFDFAGIRELAVSPPLRRLVEPWLGESCFAVRALYFDKSPEANWKVPWHQDFKVTVRERTEGRASGLCARADARDKNPLG